MLTSLRSVLTLNRASSSSPRDVSLPPPLPQEKNKRQASGHEDMEIMMILGCTGYSFYYSTFISFPKNYTEIYIGLAPDSSNIVNTLQT